MRAKFLGSTRLFDFRVTIRLRVALEEDLDILVDTVDGLLHLEGEDVAVDPKNDEE